jgi:hypothetical protein
VSDFCAVAIALAHGIPLIRAEPGERLLRRKIDGAGTTLVVFNSASSSSQ